MSDVAQRLVNWAQNAEMIDASYTEHGKDCLDVAREMEELAASRDAYSSAMHIEERLKFEALAELDEVRAELRQVQEKLDKAIEARNKAEGMAECMATFRQDMIDAGVIDKTVAPMFMTEAILQVITALEREANGFF